MKKIKFNYRDCTGRYVKNHNPITKLKETTGYYFTINDHRFVVHKYVFESGYFGGWRVSELTSGCGVTILKPTRREAIECFEGMQQKEYGELDFFATLKLLVADIISKCGKANDPAILD